MEDFKISQLTKELVAAKLRELPDPCAAAAGLVKDTLRVALRGVEAGAVPDSAVVAEACQGGMTALLLGEQNLVKGGMLILEAAIEVANELNVDQTALMMSALRGMADMRRFAGPDPLHELAAAIEARYQGAGEAFTQLCREPVTDQAPRAEPAG